MMLNSRKKVKDYMKEENLNLFSKNQIITFEKSLKIEYACIIDENKKNYIKDNINSLRKTISGYEIKYYFEEYVEYDKKTCKEKHNHPIVFNCSIELLGNNFNKLGLKYKMDFMSMFIKYIENFSKDGEAQFNIIASFKTDRDLEKELDIYTRELGYIKNITFPTQYAKFSPNIIITSNKKSVEFYCNDRVKNNNTTKKIFESFVELMKFNRDFVERYLK